MLTLKAVAQTEKSQEDASSGDQIGAQTEKSQEDASSDDQIGVQMEESLEDASSGDGSGCTDKRKTIRCVLR